MRQDLRTWRSALTAAIVGASIFSASPATVRAAEPTLVLATVQVPKSERVRSVGMRLAKGNPGYYPKLAMRAAEACGTTVEFRFLPWNRALAEVRSGQVSAAFASSYREDRAVYGAYPMKDGKPDESRAQRVYAYHLYAHKDDPLAARPWTETIKGLRIGVEAEAAIIPLLEALGAETYERTAYGNLLKMLSKGRFPMVTGIADNFDPIIAANDTLASKIARLEPALQTRVGYVMFGKAFYEANTKLVECFWDESARLRRSDWYKELRRQAYSGNGG